METKKRVLLLASIAVILAIIAVLLQLGEQGAVESSIGDGGILNSEGSGQVLLIVAENPNVEDRGTISEEGGEP